jgi:Family of unknown function (DUF5677)
MCVLRIVSITGAYASRAISLMRMLTASTPGSRAASARIALTVAMSSSRAFSSDRAVATGTSCGLRGAWAEAKQPGREAMRHGVDVMSRCISEGLLNVASSPNLICHPHGNGSAQALANHPVRRLRDESGGTGRVAYSSCEGTSTMTDTSSAKVLEHLLEILQARHIDGSFAQFTPDESDAISVGRPIPRLAALDEVVQEFVAGADRLVLPDRASHLDEQARILDLWGSTFDALDALRLLAAAVGGFREGLAADPLLGFPDPVNEALSQLFWASIIVASEVITLLRHGYASGAVARWRALYEIGVRAALISEGGAELGQRFLEHERMRHDVERRRLWREMKTYAMSDEDITLEQELDSRTRALAERYGGLFTHEYGWAHDYLSENYGSYAQNHQKGRRPNGPHLADLSRAANERGPARTLREIHYARASAATHGSPRSVGEYDDDGILHILAQSTVSSIGLASEQTAEELAELTYSFVADIVDIEEDGVMGILVLCVSRLAVCARARAFEAGQGTK